MKKVFLLAMCLLTAIGVSSKTPSVPTIILQTERASGMTMKLTLRTETPSVITIDWGNGVLGKVDTDTDNTPVEGVVSGRFVKLYGEDITYLDCSKNDLVDVNLSKAIRIGQIYCDKNKLEVLDVTNNIYLVRIGCNYNLLRELNIENNRKLTGLYIQGNKLDARSLNRLYGQLSARRTMPVNVTLRVSGNPGAAVSNTNSATKQNWNIDIKGSNTGGLPLILTFDKKAGDLIKIEMRVQSASNVGIDWGIGEQNVAVGTSTTVVNGRLVKGNQVKIYGDNINFVKCERMNVTDVDLSAGAQLQQVYLGNNELTQLDVTKNPQLTRIGCNNNKIKTLDLSVNQKLTGLYFQENLFEVAALNSIYGQLPKRLRMPEAVNFRVIGNPMAEESDFAVATAKNWMIDIAK